MFTLVLEKVEEPEIKLPTSANDQDNHHGVIIHLEPDILALECEVKWALGSITTNKVMEVMEFQLSCFKF